MALAMEQPADAQDGQKKDAVYPVIPMSCTTGENKDLFLEKVGELAMAVMGKRYHVLSYPGEEHYQRKRWLSRNGGINEEEDFEYNGETISVRVLLDDVTYQRYLKAFEPELFEQSDARKRPPGARKQKDWHEKGQK